MPRSHDGLSVVAFLLAGIVSAIPARANVGEAYGFGARNAALGGATVASPVDGFASYTNPAALAVTTETAGKLSLSWGLLVMDPEFTPINGIVTTNSYTSDQVRDNQSVDLSYRSTFGQVLGLTYHLPELRNLSFGLSTFLPLDQIIYIDTGEPYVPEYFLYRARTQRPQIDLAAGVELGRGFRFGAGIQIAFGMTANGSVLLQTNEPKPSTMRFTASLKPKAIPYLGLLLGGAPEDRLSAGAVVRFAATSEESMLLGSAVRPANLSPLDFKFNADSALYYDPLTLELGMAIKPLPSWRLLGQIDYQAWHKFQPPAISVIDTKEAINLVNSNNPTFDYQDILIPKVASEIQVRKATLRFGYGYRPSILKELPEGPGNYLDPPKHMINAGIGFQFEHFLGITVPCNLNFNASYHLLKTQRITKTLGNEIGNLGEPKVGSPGYDAGGKIVGGGVSLDFAI